MVGWDRGADRASNDADVSSILPIIPYGGFSPVRLEGWHIRRDLPDASISLSLLPACAQRERNQPLGCCQCAMRSNTAGDDSLANPLKGNSQQVCRLDAAPKPDRLDRQLSAWRDHDHDLRRGSPSSGTPHRCCRPQVAGDHRAACLLGLPPRRRKGHCRSAGRREGDDRGGFS